MRCGSRPPLDLELDLNVNPNFDLDLDLDAFTGRYDVRITGGRFRGRVLVSPPRGVATRPTTDKVRQAVFNILGREVENASVLDLFAGTGAMGFEALSRGARHATFVESEARLCAVIEKNAALLGCADSCAVSRVDVRRLSESVVGAPFDVVFVDPPYELGLASMALDALATTGVATHGARIFVEHGRRETLDLSAAARKAFGDAERRHYGDTVIACYNARLSDRGAT